MRAEMLFDKGTREMAYRVKAHYDEAKGALKAKEARWDAAMLDYVKLCEDLDSRDDPTERQEVKASIKLITAELARIDASAEGVLREYKAAIENDVTELRGILFPVPNKVDLITPPQTPIRSMVEEVIQMEDLREILTTLERRAKTIKYQIMMADRRRMQTKHVPPSTSRAPMPPISKRPRTRMPKPWETRRSPPLCFSRTENVPASDCKRRCVYQPEDVRYVLEQQQRQSTSQQSCQPTSPDTEQDPATDDNCSINDETGREAQPDPQESLLQRKRELINNRAASWDRLANAPLVQQRIIVVQVEQMQQQPHVVKPDLRDIAPHFIPKQEEL